MPLSNLLNGLLGVAIVGFFFLMIYSKFRNQSLKESWEEIKGIFHSKKDDVIAGVGEVRRK